MRPIDLKANVVQVSETARVRQAADRADEHGRAATAHEGLRVQQRRREQVERPATLADETRVRSDGRRGGGGENPDRQGSGDQRDRQAPATGDDPHKGRYLDISV